MKVVVLFLHELVERGADVKARDMRNATPLHFASFHGRPEIAQLLFEHGANAQAEDNLGRSPLHEVSRGVYEHQRYPFFTMGTPGVRVYHPQKTIDVALLLLERGVDVNALDENHTTPLHLASSYGLLDIAQLLLDHGATANAENVYGQTPLHLVSQDSCEITGPSPSGFQPFIFSGPSGPFRDPFSSASRASRQLLDLPLLFELPSLIPSKPE
jgi:hypothetical protein